MTPKLQATDTPCPICGAKNWLQRIGPGCDLCVREPQQLQPHELDATAEALEKAVRAMASMRATIASMQQRVHSNESTCDCRGRQIGALAEGLRDVRRSVAIIGTQHFNLSARLQRLESLLLQDVSGTFH